MKLLFLQYLYNLSDVKVIEEANCNLAFLWFLGLNPEDKLPDAMRGVHTLTNSERIWIFDNGWGG